MGACTYNPSIEITTDYLPNFVLLWGLVHGTV
jgi:hypothetical protein